MRILITGGAGFIGSHIQDALLSAGHTVGILDSLRSGKKENIAPKSEFFEVDMRDTQKVLETFKTFKPEALYHLAAQNEVPYSMEHPREDLETNIIGMYNLLEAGVQTGLQKVIYSNTGGAYYGEVPDTDLPIVEDHPVSRPTSFYGVSKAAAEQYLKLFSMVHGLKYVSLRYSNVYGPRQAGNKEAGIIAIFTTKLLQSQTPTINGDGSHTRDYVYVGDVVAANLAALEYEHNDYFNIATGVETSNNQVYQYLTQAFGISTPPQYGPARPGDVLRNSLSIAKAQKLLGWTPQVDIRTGIHQTVAWYQSHS